MDYARTVTDWVDPPAFGPGGTPPPRKSELQLLEQVFTPLIHRSQSSNSPIHVLFDPADWLHPDPNYAHIYAARNTLIDMMDSRDLEPALPRRGGMDARDLSRKTGRELRDMSLTSLLNLQPILQQIHSAPEHEKSALIEQAPELYRFPLIYPGVTGVARDRHLTSWEREDPPTILPPGMSMKRCTRLRPASLIPRRKNLARPSALNHQSRLS
jgi:hypothetical protein